ncbi:MAG: hypothetical protein AAF772_04295 [Acidobacteriota bacterium]
MNEVAEPQDDVLRVLIAVASDAPFAPIARALDGHPSLTVNRYTRSDQAFAALPAEQPDVLLLDPAIDDGRGLELLGLAIRLVKPPVVIVPSYVGYVPIPALAVDPAIHLVDPTLGVDDTIEMLEIAHAGRHAGGFELHLIDALRAAVASGLSVSLHAGMSSSREALIQVIGGDVWNVVLDEVQLGPGALDEILVEPLEGLSVTPLRAVPRRRQIRCTGRQLLLQALGMMVGGIDLPGTAPAPAPGPEAPAADAKAAPAATGSARPLIANPTTRPLSVEQLRVELRSVAAVLNEAIELRANDAGASADDIRDVQFEKAFSEGLEAALARDYAKAEQCFEEALIFKPDHSLTLFNLGRVRKMLAELPTAAEDGDSVTSTAASG